MSFKKACDEERLGTTQVFEFDTPVTVFVTEHYVIINPGFCHALRINIERGKMHVDDWWGWGT